MKAIKSPPTRLLAIAALLAALPAAAAPGVTDLGTLKNDKSGNSQAVSFNSDGSIVVGFADNDNGRSRATVWSGNGWTTKTDLGTLKSDNSGYSYARGLSDDGSVIFGEADSDNGQSRATVWSGSN